MNTPGKRVGGRFELQREQVAEEDLRRWRAVDTQTGAQVEVVSPRPHALLRDGARAAFGEVQFEHVAVLPVVARFEEEGVPYVVRPATQGTLAGVRLAPGEAAALLGWLAPAVLRAGGRFGGELRGEDVVIDEGGTPRLAGVQLPRGDSLARVPHHRAPEVLDGNPPTAASDLFGLGVLVFKAVTGTYPWPATSMAQLRRRELAAPRLSDHVAVPEALDAAVAGLLDLDPPRRVEAAEHVAPATAPLLTAPPLHDAPVVQRAQRAVTPVHTRPPYVVVSPLAGLTENQLRRIAVRTGVEFESVRRAAERGGDWLMDAADSAAEADRALRRISSRGLPARVQGTEAPRIVQWLLLGVFAGVAGFAFWSPLNLVVWVLSALLLGWAARNLAGVVPVARVRAALRDRQHATAAAGPEVRALALARRSREAEHLPGPVRTDLREAADRALDQLADIAGAEAELGTEDHLSRGRLHADRERIAHALAQLDVELSRAAAEANLDPGSARIEELGRLARELGA